MSIKIIGKGTEPFCIRKRLHIRKSISTRFSSIKTTLYFTLSQFSLRLPNTIELSEFARLFMSVCDDDFKRWFYDFMRAFKDTGKWWEHPDKTLEAQERSTQLTWKAYRTWLCLSFVRNTTRQPLVATVPPSSRASLIFLNAYEVKHYTDKLPPNKTILSRFYSIRILKS